MRAEARRQGIALGLCPDQVDAMITAADEITKALDKNNITTFFKQTLHGLPRPSEMKDMIEAARLALQLGMTPDEFQELCLECIRRRS